MPELSVDKPDPLVSFFSTNEYKLSYISKDRYEMIFKIVDKKNNKDIGKAIKFIFL